jgi:predicted nucleic acid-binding protein
METKTELRTIVIADTSALFALLSPTDADHQKALALTQQLRQQQIQILAPEAVYTELLNILGKKISHQVAIDAAELLTSSGPFAIADVVDAYPLALDKFRVAPASVSFTDCVVAAAADHIGTKQIFGFDAYFEKQGYQIPSPDELEEAA